MKTTPSLSHALVGTCLVLSACAGDADSNKQSSDSSKTDLKPASSEAAPVASAKPATAGSAADSSSSSSASPSANASATTPSTSAAQPASNKPGDASTTAVDVKTPLKDLSADCKGFEVLGLKESPGGDVLPNKCAPFHGLYNNPYAIRCVDADPSYKTDFPGDEYCVLPPPAALGTQLHVAPDDMKKPGTFVLPAGAEENTNYYMNSSNTEDHYYYRVNWRMRAGSHHMIITVSDADRADGWAADLQGASARNVGAAGFDTSGGSRSFGGSQRPDLDRPQGTLKTPPENVGIGALLKAKQQFSFNLHHINTTDKPILREAWVNVWYMDKSEVTKEMKGLSASGSPVDVSIPAHQRTVLKYRCDVQGSSRIITMNGHRHAHTDRFAVWLQKQGGGDEVRAYESFNWEDMPTYQYDSVSKNPAPDVTNKVDGASSGELNLEKGDQLYFLCDINNTLDTPLKFANEAIDGEMCILFGSYLGDTAPCSGGAQRIRGDADTN